MTRIQKAFFEQIELEEEDVKRDFLTSYVYGLLDEEEKKPVQRAVDMLNDELSWTRWPRRQSCNPGLKMKKRYAWSQ